MARLVELLRAPRRPGFPADYLLARLPARRALRRATCPGGVGEEPWRELERELDWLHNQLDAKLRGELAPALLFFELPHLLTALRFCEAGDQHGVAESLGRSRLAAPVRAILAGSGSFPAKLRELGDYLAGFDPGLAGVAEARRDRGRAGLEQALAAGIYAAALREQPSGPVRGFLEWLADRQGLLRLVKAERWPWTASALAPTQHLPRLRQALAARHPETTADPAALERVLLRRITQESRRKSRTGGRHAQLLDYLWTCYLIARDCGVRSLEGLLGEARVKEETLP